MDELKMINEAIAKSGINPNKPFILSIGKGQCFVEQKED